MDTILMLALMFAVFYFMLIRPENKRKKDNETMRSGLKKGDVITSIGGVVGTIVKVNNSTIIVETSEDRVRLELTKWAVSSVGVQTGEQPEKKKNEKPELTNEDMDFEPPVITEPAVEVPAEETKE